MKIVITGAGGLLGWHTAAAVHARNCAARFRGEEAPWELVQINHADFDNDETLGGAITDADVVLHFAGVNRARQDIVETANPAIADRLVKICAEVDSRPHVVYANTIHANADTPYGRSKRRAGEILRGAMDRYTNLILPHIFGEGARPNYNNVTATFVNAVIKGEKPNINSDGRVSLLHAGVVANVALEAVENRIMFDVRPQSYDIAVSELYQILKCFHSDYMANIFPDLSSDFTLALFNTYRAALYPTGFPRPLKLISDARGTLFEAIKGGGGGQVFLSTTRPGVTRGDHFHMSKVERFLVVQGEAIIRIRKVLSDEVWEYRVSGAAPAPVDMPTLHTHSIENVGEGPLLTLFWTHDLFDSLNPDTYADKVLR
ncbi:capsule biosynthesis protein CapF [Porphyrobacter sp. HT-58-2]|uniref:polysaccharide biosynthesis C-terminal domain-containing protein n=1 Tax=Porphyrobacter sp. HT-58-2 TaxID=2023229 RepID=UPI000CDC1207|nr:NAD-dependent epimerase/dehydratase family protein [Porphyrobacter sp. HT-58-2]AUX69623.1 capsule biosynthesis protein CapF [Porphyrobacter sp. HT-58-2]